MLISPPFLLARGETESEDAWLDRCMAAGASGEGAFPVSFNLGWHGGMHLTAPRDGASFEPVRAIADGTVVYRRDPSQAPAGPLPENHPQAYRGGWTDNGVVVIRHDTEIGDGANGAVRFFSIYMHLSAVDSDVSTTLRGGRIFRKSEIGHAGQIYGSADRRIHFEIVCNDENLVKLAGRASGELSLDADGRTDCVYGTMYVHLPAGTHVYAEEPLPNSAAAVRRPAPSPSQPHPPPVALRPVHATASDVIIGLRPAGGDGAAGHRGSVFVQSYRLDGSKLGGELEEVDGEYDFYTRAKTISESYPAGARPAASAVYELLRFSRVIGPDALVPADVPCWRRVRHDGFDVGWVNVNATGLHKFSDADFPQWRGWRLVDDSVDRDSRCDSAVIRGWLDSDGDGTVRSHEASRRLADDEVAPKLARAICKFATEWDASRVDGQWGWLKTETVENPTPLSEKDFDRLRAHIVALQFWPGGTGLPPAHWHFQPREFVRHFRQCGWLSSAELVQCIPRNSPAGLVGLATARVRIAAWGLSVNGMARKFGIDSTIRMTHLLAHVWAETGYLRLLREAGADGARYAPYIGRGLIQITWQDKYEAYGEFAHLTANYAGANFDLELIATDAYHAGNSSGFYWVSKDIWEPRDHRATSLSRVADEGTATDSIGKLCLWINGGGNHYDHRHIHFFFIDRILNDNAPVAGGQWPTADQKTFHKMEFIREMRTVNGHLVRVIVGTRPSTVTMSIGIDYAPQR